jgi:hypothetical protein
MIFIFLYLFFPFCWHFLLKLAGITFSKVNIMTLVIAGIIFYQYLGLPLLYFRLDPFRSDDVTDVDLVFLVFLYLLIYTEIIGGTALAKMWVTFKTHN